MGGEREKARTVLLHGKLHVKILEIDRASSSGSCCNFFCKITKNIDYSDRIKRKCTLKVYITIDIGNARVGRTRLQAQEHGNHQWNESLHIYTAHNASHVTFSIKESQPVGAKVIGQAHIPAEELLEGLEIDKWLTIIGSNHKSQYAGSRLHVQLQYFNATRDPNWSKGIETSDFPGVPYTYFKQRNGCRVTLYQDAHTPNEFFPKISLSEGKYYSPKRCWEDVFDAISNAKHLIYITGWSIYAKITLLRDPQRERFGKGMTCLTLGELLIKKANEGVTVLMLVWDDRTSLKLLKLDGVMATHDEDTETYFHKTAVHCVLCPRYPDNRGSIVQDLKVSTIFTHHQKIVIVDGEISDELSAKRRIVSFIGGIDLCDGRYDTPFHSIFGTLDTAHNKDFHQPNFLNASIKKGGPREPWHDVHSKLEGPVAWDVLVNFEERWRKQGGKGDLLIRLTENEHIFIAPSQDTLLEDQEKWNVQLFRSIDGGAAYGFPDDPKDASRKGLVSWKDNIIDRSIQDGYINAIRRAKNFIYIENQYFLGSSYGWITSDKDNFKVEEKIGAVQLIPKELSLKIVSKIEAGERFMVYVVIPMWPEGVPESHSVQAILNWQRKTMEMMYSDIAKAIELKGIKADPNDYLSFFCLGNKETKKSVEYQPPEKPERHTDYSRAQQARRFMIYVHAKMMIVDDEYIIIGSANINQRSMDGARDTEIAMGAHQPHHLAINIENPARGQIHGFRIALWYEHMGSIDEVFLQPESLNCVRKVNQIAKSYWDLYCSEETLDRDLPGHLLSYPISVAENGEVRDLPGTHFFPDTKGLVRGANTELLPPILTT